jgi:hypothetical protein
MRYYFISYEWHYRGQENRFANEISDIHPLKWLLNTKENNKGCYCTLLSWNEITEEEYKTYNLHIG